MSRSLPPPGPISAVFAELQTVIDSLASLTDRSTGIEAFLPRLGPSRSAPAGPPIIIHDLTQLPAQDTRAGPGVYYILSTTTSSNPRTLPRRSNALHRQGSRRRQRSWPLMDDEVGLGPEDQAALHDVVADGQDAARGEMAEDLFARI